MAGPRILTFNFHEPYLSLLAKTGLDFSVGEYSSGPLVRSWQTQFRPVPENMTLVEESSWRTKLDRGFYDLVIAHNEVNAADVCSSRTPAILVCHNRRQFVSSRLSSQGGNQGRDYDELLTRLQENYYFVYISDSKRASYGIAGAVIYPGIDVEEYGGYRGDTPEVLRVGNAMRGRNLMFDVDFQEAVCEGIPNRVVGEDPQIPGAAPSKSWNDLRETYRSLRCLLHVTREDWEDGYNLSTLEAMATGMPVAALANPTSPFTDGLDGYVSGEAAVLRQRIEGMLADLDAAKEIGARGRETVAKKFPISVFVENWQRAIDEVAQSSSFRGPVPKALESGDKGDPVPTLDVVVEYVKSPHTTGRYFEEALREKHQVVSAGPRCPEAVIREWGFGGDIPTYPPHDVDLFHGAPYRTMRDRLPENFHPGLFLYVDSGVREFSKDIDAMDCVRACYLIDTHVDCEWRIEVARHFHFAFIAQKAHVAKLRQAGIRNAFWLPLACSPELHKVGEMERIYDVGFVGSLIAADTRRAGLLKRIGQRFPNSSIGKAWPKEMAKIYAQSKIVVNASLNDDLNMRVFEAMASGALLITDKEYGLESLFENGTHLVIYENDEEVFELVEKYLADDGARERIARAGQELVLAEHTYRRRLDTMIEMVLAATKNTGGNAGENRFEQGGYYRSPRPEIARQVPLDAKRVLDVGCGAGELGASLKEERNCEVVGIEVVERAYELARRVLDDAVLGNIEEMELPFDDGYFDCIICGDVLEHLVQPVDALRKLKRVLSPEGVVIISIPNVRFYEVVRMLVSGRWEYMDAGILDRTHLRFFTRVEIAAMLREAGLTIQRLEPLSMAPVEMLPLGPDRTLNLGRMTIRDVTDAEYTEFRTYQYLAVAGRPDADILDKVQRFIDAEEFSEAYSLAEEARGVDEVRRKSLLGTAIARLGKLDTAEEHYRAALTLDPANAEVKGKLGILLVAMQRAGEARSYLLEARESQPDDYRVTGALGLAALLEEDLNGAYDFFKRSIELHFDNEAILRHLIATAEKLNRLQDIEEQVNKFVEFAPGNLDMGLTHAALLSKLGNDIEAREKLDTILMLSPGHEQAKKLLDEIDGRGVAAP